MPIELEQDVITFPLLAGELYPLVDVKPIDKGRRIMGASVNTPHPELGRHGQSVHHAIRYLMCMIRALDTTIFVVDGAVLIRT